MTKSEPRKSRARRGLPRDLVAAADAAYGKNATDVVALDLHRAAAFTDYFLMCSGRSARQVRAIVDAIDDALRRRQVRATHIEGYDRGDWVLMDYFDFIVHVFVPETREFYALERLWGSADRLEVPDPNAAAVRGARQR
jgi:ribosome-associated protein